MQVGILGTGYAAKARATALKSDGRTTLRWIAGRQGAGDLAQQLGCESYYDWTAALSDPLVELVFICTATLAHAPMVELALQHGKQVVVEYPLALDYPTGLRLYELAQQKGLLLHIEHIELLSDLHRQLQAAVPQLGALHYARSVTLTPTHPAPQKWNYHREEFGFPLVGALSRISRLIDLMGKVESVFCQNQYQHLNEGYFQTCYCTAQLKFQSGALAEVLYGKGEGVWRSEISLELQGGLGAVVLDGEQLTFFSREEPRTTEAGSRKGLFLRDTQQVLDHLFTGSPLYVSAEHSLAALEVATACAESAANGKMINIRYKS